ncbi:MAG: flagellar filament capping protein FliD [Acidobacteria bacterium]|nr:flagellar filament capping protein FliD [Acidobacteriota bacterium]
MASLSSPIYSGHLLVSSARGLGFASLSGDQSIALGAHTITVTQSTAAATKTGTAPLAANTVITGANNTIDIDVDGINKTYTIAASGPGGYTAAQLAAAVQAASGGDLTASLDGTGALVLKTAEEGSAATMKVNVASTALGVLSLTADGAALTGVDGALTVDGGAPVTVTSTKAGVPLVLAATGGNVTATFAAGLRAGTTTANNVDTGDGSLQSVANAINGAQSGVNATAVQTTPGNFRLQLTSTSTGVASAITLAANTFGALGTLQSLSTGQDATLTVGTGPAAYTVTSSTNSVSGVLSGVTINLAATGTTSITVATDAGGLADQVNSLFKATNDVLQFIKDNASFDASTNSGGPLLGDFAIRQLADHLLSGVIDGVATSSFGNPSAVGFQTTKDGLLTFDRDKFLAAQAQNPQGVQSLFAQGGVATNAAVSAIGINDRTQQHTAFPVVITTAGQQASVTGAVVGGGIANAEQIDVKVGATTASYSALAGASLTSIADGLNASMLAQNLGVIASVQGGALVLTSRDYGASTTFSVQSNQSGVGSTQIVTASGAFEPHTGVNVAGTINGVAAIGSGQALVAPINDPILQGLSLRITATAAQVAFSTNFGSFSVENGAAQRLSTVADAGSAIDIGSITNNLTSRKSQIDQLNTQIADWDTRLAQRQDILRAQFTQMETALANMKAQSNWLASQTASLNANVNGGG